MVRPQLLELKSQREKVANVVESTLFIRFITALILINAVTLGLETDKATLETYGSALYWIDKAILIVFTIEITAKLYAYRLSFFRSGWNVFDLIIISISWVPANETLAILRALRILRVLRLISVVPQMRRVISAIGHSLPGMSSIIGVLSIIFYVSSVLATKLFGMGDNAQLQEWFGSVGASAYTLFQIMTLESWSMGIVRPVMEVYPLAWMFFVPFIIVTSFAVLNLFIGIIVDAMQASQKDEKDAEEDRRIRKIIREENEALHQKIEQILLQNQYAAENDNKKGYGS